MSMFAKYVEKMLKAPQSRTQSVLALLAFFVIAATVAVFPYFRLASGFDASLFHTADEYLTSGPHLDADQKSYVVYAREVLAKKSLSTEQMTRLAPGFPMLVALKMQLLGQANFPFQMKLWAAMMWAIALFSLLQATQFPKEFWPRFFILNFVWTVPTMRFACLGEGSMTPESMCMSLLTMSLAGVLYAYRTGERRGYIFSVVMLSLACYFRPIFDLVGLAIFAGLLVPFALKVAARLNRSYAERGFAGLSDLVSRVGKIWQGDETTVLYRRTLMLVLFCVINAPWKVFVYSHFRHFTMSTDAYYLTDSSLWVTKWAPISAADLGGNTACRVDPALCRTVEAAGPSATPEIRTSLALYTMITHPLAWAMYEIPSLKILWFSHLDWLNPGRSVTLAIDGILFLSFLLATSTLWYRLYRDERLAPAARKSLRSFGLIAFGFLAIHIVIFALKTPQFQYALPLKSLLLFSPLALMTIATMKTKAVVRRTTKSRSPGARISQAA